jgi:GT2 family glycosyltransferase
MRLSIVTVNWNTNDLLEALLKSISRYPPRCDYEVVVVDNASEGFDASSFRARFPEARLIANRHNAGYAAGNNQGVEIASGDLVLLLNPDTEVTDGALDALVRFMVEHPDAAAAGAKLVRPDGTVERSVRSFPYPGPIAWEFLGLSKLFPKSSTLGRYRMAGFSYAQAAEVDQPMGSCLILRRSAIEKVGAFDTQFPTFFNEVDWLYRARQARYKAYFTPDAVVIHHGGASTRQAGRRKMVRESHESLIRFYKKHFKGSVSPPVYYFTVACIALGKYLRGWF